jgi:hypothetical protein
MNYVALTPIGFPSDFKEVLDYVIKPAFDESGYRYTVVRADEIDRSGSFIKDILESIYSAHVVIADLTGQNPNVFYELGVRHSLRPRTILIAQNIDDIPSDLREYRTIIYDTTAKGAAGFKKRIKSFLTEMQKEPERPDNPVLDRLGSITENRLSQLEAEKDSLKEELSKYLSGKMHKTTDPAKSVSAANVRVRFDRILSLKGAEHQSILGGHFSRGAESFSLPVEQGNFRLYFLKNGKSIDGFWYVSVRPSGVDIEDELSDIRVLLENCSKGQNAECDFILVCRDNIENKTQYLSHFEKMKEFITKDFRKKFTLHLLDPEGLSSWEKELGLKI